jgi:hypothetical protein
LGIYHPVMRHHIAQEWRPQLHCCESVKTWRIYVIFVLKCVTLLVKKKY